MSQGARSMRWWNVVGIVGMAVLMSAGVASAASEWTVAYASAEKVPLNAIWGSSADDVWAVGEGGTVIHYDGSTWSAINAGSYSYLAGVWGSGPKDVYIVGSSGTILHYDGTAWTNVECGVTAHLYGVWGSGPKDVYVVGVGTVLHYDGTTWDSIDLLRNFGVECPGNVFYDVWGSGPADVHVCQSPASTPHLFRSIDLSSVYEGDRYNGESWEPFGGTECQSVVRGEIWGSDSDNVYAIGNDAMFHYDGMTWTQIAQPTAIGPFSLWGSGAEDIFVSGAEDLNGVMFHFDGDSWAKMTSDSTQVAMAIWGSGPKDVYAVGRLGEILHCSGFVPRETKEYALQVVGYKTTPASGLYPAGTTLTVKTEAFHDEWWDLGSSSLYGFDGWAGDDGHWFNPTAVTMDRNVLLAAKYEEIMTPAPGCCTNVLVILVGCCLLSSWMLAGRE